MKNKDIPKRIWLQREDAEHPESDSYFGEGMTWCEDKLNKNDIEYIRRDVYDEATSKVSSLEDEILELRSEIQSLGG